MRVTKNSFSIYASRNSIDNSVRNDLSYCIFAIAVVESIPGAQRVLVDKHEVRFTWKSHRYTFPTPAKSAQIAQDYDNGLIDKKDIQPWHDKLENPISIEKIQRKRKRKNGAYAKKTATKRSRTRRVSRWDGRKI